MATLATVLTGVTALLVALSGYLQYAVRRAIFPCLEMDIDVSVIAPATEMSGTIAELVLTVRNIGPGVGYVERPQCRVMYAVAADGDQARKPEPAFPNRVCGSDTQDIFLSKGFLIAAKQERAFIQAGITQTYRKPILLPGDARLVTVWAGFVYEIEAGRLLWSMARLVAARPQTRMVNHTARRTVWLSGQQVDVP